MCLYSVFSGRRYAGLAWNSVFMILKDSSISHLCSLTLMISSTESFTRSCECIMTVIHHFAFYFFLSVITGSVCNFIFVSNCCLFNESGWITFLISMFFFLDPFSIHFPARSICFLEWSTDRRIFSN